MFAGGIGAWLYDDALGLRVSHVPRLPQPLGAFAPAVDARCTSSTSSIALHEVGLSKYDHGALCAALDVARATCARHGATGFCSYADVRSIILRQAAAAQFKPSNKRTSRLDLVVVAAPDADIVATLGSARGWRKVAAGIARLEWQWNAAPSGDMCSGDDQSPLRVLSMNASMPPGAAQHIFAVGVPLSRAALAASLCAPAKGALRVVASFSSLPSTPPFVLSYSVVLRDSLVAGFTTVKPLDGRQEPPLWEARLVSHDSIHEIASWPLERVETDVYSSTPYSLDRDSDTLLLKVSQPGLFEISVELY